MYIFYNWLRIFVMYLLWYVEQTMNIILKRID
jgi:hypothetical protein